MFNVVVPAEYFPLHLVLVAGVEGREAAGDQHEDDHAQAPQVRKCRRSRALHHLPVLSVRYVNKEQILSLYTCACKDFQ